MGQAAVYIDGGYLAKVLKHFGAPRVDHHEFSAWACGKDTLFRVYYYDCLPYQSNPPTNEEIKLVNDKQKFFAALRSGKRFTVREGRLEYRGNDSYHRPIFIQKRVDLQLGLDLASLVAKDRVDTIVLVTGDSDFIPAVDFAQQEGVIIRLIHGPKDTYHQDLWEVVDERVEITREVLEAILLENTMNRS